ncbi:MAG: NAD+ synthase [Planctomycetota bacterium]|nr:NAD+ synthase [Planctomycetota bacterium]
MRIALARFDALVGDVPGNSRRMLDRAVELAGGGADCVVFPELSVVGYPPRDLLQREGFVESCERAVVALAADLLSRGAGGVAVLVGASMRASDHGGPLMNVVALLRGGRVEATYAKRLLPDYDVFDEPRHFAAGSAPLVFACGTERVGVVICEDLWRAEDALAAGHSYSIDPVAETVAAGATVIVCPSASPCAAGKHARHTDILRSAARRGGVPICSLNASGADDDLVFDGDARIVFSDSTAISAPRWGNDALLHNFQVRSAAHESTDSAAVPGAEHAERWHTIVAGITGYFRKTGHTHAVLGLSGGIDSALVAALAVAALGADRVTGILMPSRFSSDGSRTDAWELARRLGMRALEIPIEPAHDALASHLTPYFASAGASLEGLADENLQSRLRGMQLMAFSNATGALVLATGNKSEYAVGYSTLYGDMCGALAPIGDLLKTDVWTLARWANAHCAELGLASGVTLGFATAPIPEASITKIPSAELRPDQADQDTLPPYEMLDAIVRGWIEEERSIDAIAAAHMLDRALVERWTRAIDMAQYKRAQAPVIIRLSARAFGLGRRMPIVMRDVR